MPGVATHLLDEQLTQLITHLRQGLKRQTTQVIRVQYGGQNIMFVVFHSIFNIFIPQSYIFFIEVV